MRRSLLVLVVSLFSTHLFAAQLNVVATLPVLGDIARKVGGNLVSVQTLAEPNQDPHFVIPNPVLMKKTGSADVFIENGLSLELWAGKIVDGSGNARIQEGKPGRIVASKGVATKEIPAAMSRALGDIHPGGNPHIWLDPINAKTMARNIANGFAAADPKNKDAYAKGADKFAADIDTKMVEWQKIAQNRLKGRSIVTYHKSFIYFAQRFGLAIEAEIEEKPGISPTARYRDELIATMQRNKIDTIVMELYYDRTAAPEYIAAKTGARIVQVPIDVGADPEAADYFSLIDLLIKRI